MIVKNESHVIKNTLQNLCKYINFSYYVISDTGSTDNTIEIIKSFFDSINVKGEIYIDTWKDFGYNRSLALKYAYKKTKYLMIFDADDIIHGEFTLPEIMEHDSYYLNMGNGVKYKRLLIVNNHLTWAFIGVLHEFIICNDKKEPSNLHIEGNYHIESGKTGSRSNDPEKYNKDALILEKAFYEAEKNNDNLKVRYSFYTAQSYRDANNKEKALLWYKKRIDFKDWNQELYFSHYMIGILYRDLGEIEKALYYWTLALDVDEERIECQYEIISYYRKLGLWRLAYNNFKMIENKYINVNLNNKLFTYYNIYNFLINYELSIISYHVNKIDKGIEHYKKLFLLGKNIGIELQINVLDNFSFYIDHVKFDIDLFESYCNFIKSIYNITKRFIDKHTIQINRMVTKMTSYYNNKILLNNIIGKIICR
jgi:tetratricopeptide (TPR) repeat protein